MRLFGNIISFVETVQICTNVCAIDHVLCVWSAINNFKCKITKFRNVYPNVCVLFNFVLIILFLGDFWKNKFYVLAIFYNIDNSH